MATFFRGVSGLKEEFVKERHSLANRLLADDKRRDRGERTMTKAARASVQGQILGLNYAILCIDGATVLREDEFDRTFGARDKVEA